MTERFQTVGDVELCYETFGDRADPALLLIMGLGTQMVAWHEEFCAALVARGFHVIRFDNRDVGRSTHLSDVAPPTPLQVLVRSRRPAAYTLADMARDAAGLLEGLGIEAAHVVGASMGGMIGQTLAARHPERVRSLASIMSTTGSLFVGHPSPRLLRFFLTRPPADREAYLERLVELFDAIGSPGFDRDEAELRELMRLSYERSSDPVSAGRQLAAIFASANRTAELRRIRVPTLVIHGDADRLVPLSGGRATARAIPGARLMVVRGMGHDLPRGAWPALVGAIAENAARPAHAPAA